VWFDTHTHLSDAKFDKDRDEVINRAFKDGLQGIVEIADGPSEWDKAKALAQKYRGKMWWTAGIHPYFADQGSESIFNQIEEHCKSDQMVAIGEVGLDYFKCTIPKDVQKQTFIRAISLAKKVDKPLIIHCREAYDDLLPILREHFPNPPKNENPFGVIHCFSGNFKDIQDIFEIGFYAGMDGPLTYPSAEELRETISKAPLEKLVLETDSPYLPPQGYRGKRNEPGFVSIIGEKLAQIKEIPANQLDKTLLQTCEKLFRLHLL